MINIAILGYGQVSKIFIEKIKKNLDVNIKFILTKNLHKEKLPFIQDHNLIYNYKLACLQNLVLTVIYPRNLPPRYYSQLLMKIVQHCLPLLL